MDSYIKYLPLPASSTLSLDVANFDVTDSHFWWATFVIIFNPLFWNVIGRLEHKTRILTRLCFGRSKVACGIFGVIIILLGMCRAHMINLACHAQPSWIFLRQNQILIIGYICCVVGQIFIWGCFYQLGFYSAFGFGDYFGFFPRTAPVTAFPFSVLEDPMYVGTPLYFFGLALVKSSPAGLLLSIIVGVSYRVALCFETPFMKSIYEGIAKKMEHREKAVEEEESVPKIKE